MKKIILRPDTYACKTSSYYIKNDYEPSSFQKYGKQISLKKIYTLPPSRADCQETSCGHYIHDLTKKQAISKNINFF